MIIHNKNYFTNKYKLTRTHSKIIEAIKIVKPNKTLNLGYNNGHNNLYLAANSYNINTWNKNAINIANVKHIKSIKNLNNLHTRIINLNNLTFARQYNFILSTMMLIFLKAKTIPRLIANMQHCTKPGSYNLIMAAINSANYPYTISFPFAFKKKKLHQYYKGWKMVKYNKNISKLHHTNANDNHIKLHFATILAHKK